MHEIKRKVTQSEEHQEKEFSSVAVLISVFREDRLEWFSDAIESVRSQDYEGEVRIYLGVDGPLSDELSIWIKGHAELFHKIVTSEINLGLSKMLNRLLGVVEDEEYLFRMDSDDLSVPYRFSRQVHFLETHPEVDAVGGSIWEFGGNANLCCLREYPVRHEAISRYITKANPMAHVTICFRKRFFDKVPAYPDRYRYNQDLALWVLAMKSRVQLANLTLPLVCVRTSDEFFRRRGYARAYSELLFYLQAIYNLHGISWRLFVPFSRFLSRLLPAKLIEMLYGSRIRAWLRRVDL